MISTNCCSQKFFYHLCFFPSIFLLSKRIPSKPLDWTLKFFEQNSCISLRL